MSSKRQNYLSLENMYNFRFLLSGFLMILLFLTFLMVPRDLDLGWHLKYGEYYFFHHAMLASNTFSMEMPYYHYINSAWGNDLIEYIVFHFFGFSGLSIMGALIATVMLYVLGAAVDMSLAERFVLFPVLYIVLYLVMGVSFRDQYFTFLAIAILCFLLERFERYRGVSLFFVILLFWLWVNIHGEFILGLGLFTFWLIVFLIRLYFTKQGSGEQSRRERIILYISWIGSCIATLLNPYGIGIYQEVLRYVNSPIRFIVVEWTPVDLFSLHWWYLVIWGILLFINILILFRLKKLTRYLFYILSTAGLFYISFGVRRYMWPMFLFSMPLMVWLPRQLYEYKRRIYYFFALVIACIFGVCYFLFVVRFTDIFHMNWNRYCVYTGCSPKSAEFLTAYHYHGKLFSFYNWGGWLIWNYPKVKPSVDGRMTFWKDDKGYSAFAEQFLLLNDVRDIDKTGYDTVYIPPYVQMYYHLFFLVQQKKWSIVYNDGIAAVFVRNK